MKKLLYLFLLLVIALLGFSLGRLTGVGDPTEPPPMNVEHPLLPPPPESTPYVPGSPKEDEDQRIVIETPGDDTSLSGAFSVTGRALVATDEALMVAVVTEKDGEEETLYEDSVGIDHEDGERYGRFDVAVGPLDVSEESTATVRVFFRSVEGEDTDIQERTVTLEPRDDRVDVDVFFQNQKLDPTVTCDLVFSVKRKVAVGTQVYRAALAALLDGPTGDETTDGYNTSIPSHVKLLSVTADDNGIVTADFDSHLDAGVAGSCRVSAIREQITRTLSQFPEVRGVVISVEGDVDGALQP